MRANRKRKQRFYDIGRYLFLMICVIFALFPIYWIVVTGLKNIKEIINVNQVTYWPIHIAWENFNDLFVGYDYLRMMINTIKLGLINGGVVCFLSMFGGYGLARFNFKGKSMMTGFFLIIQIMPMMLSQIPIYALFSSLKLVNTHLGMGILYASMAIPFNTITMRSFFERIPVSLEEAALVDGCSKLRALFKIVIPVMRPAIITVFINGFTVAWNDIISASIFINSRSLWTVNVGLFSLIGKFQVEWGALMAGTSLALIPSIIMFAITQKYIVAGSTAGAVKG